MKLELHDDHLPTDAPDDAWLRLVAQRGWIALSKDKNLLRNQAAQVLIRTIGARVFFLTRQELKGTEMGEIFTKALRRIKNVARTNRGGVVAQVFRDGHAKTLWGSAGKKR